MIILRPLSLGLFIFAPYLTQASITVTPATNITIETLEGERTHLQTGQKSELNYNAPFWIKSQGRLPIILIPLSSADAHLTIDPPRSGQSDAFSVGPVASTDISKIMRAIDEIKKSISERNHKNAQAKMTQILSEYPNIGYLHMVSASVYILSGQKSEAEKALKKALEFDSSLSEAKEMMKSLEDSE